MRIRIVQKPTEGCVDGIDLVSFEINAEYEVGSLIGSLLLAEGWAQPVDPAPPPSAVAWPLDIEYTTRPPNLIREITPPYFDCAPVLAQDRRRHPRPRRYDTSRRFRVR